VLKVLHYYICVSFFNIWTYDLVFRLILKSCGYIFLTMKTWCDVHGVFEEIFLFFIDYMYIKYLKHHLNLNSSSYKYFWGFSYFITIKILITLKICILVEVHLHTTINFILSCFIFLNKLSSTSSSNV
jgi:hypothetical protein